MNKAAKVGMLFPAEREVYNFRRPTPGEPGLPCIRCGNPCTTKGSVFTVRDKGTRWRNAEDKAIHTRCVPSGDAPIGIKARSLRASQVRAGRDG